MDRRSGENKTLTNSVTDNFAEQKLLESVEEDRVYKAQEFQKLKQKSFILQKPLSQTEKRAATSTFEREQDIDNIMNKINQYQDEKYEASNATWRDAAFWKYYMKNNIDLFSLIMVETTAMIGLYPFLTLKTRIQAQHKTEDVCFFSKNNVKKAPTYYGISQAMAGILVGNVISHSVYRLVNAELWDNPVSRAWGQVTRTTIAFGVGDIISAPFRAPFEVRRMLIQMNVQNISHDNYFRAVRKSIAPIILRDLVFRSAFNAFFNLSVYFNEYKLLFSSNDERQKKYIQAAIDRKTVEVTYQRQIKSMMFATSLAVMISNPIDVIITRLSCQQYNKYTGFVNCFKTILKEEGPGKLFLSGFGFRMGFYLINGSIMLNGYESFRNMVKDAYE